MELVQEQAAVAKEAQRQAEEARREAGPLLRQAQDSQQQVKPSRIHRFDCLLVALVYLAGNVTSTGIVKVDSRVHKHNSGCRTLVASPLLW